MAWIYNKKTKVLTECRNNDVIDICKKDVDGYLVNEDKGKIKQYIDLENTQVEDPAEKELDTLTIPELKKLAKEAGIDGYDSLTESELLKVLGG